MPETLAHHLAAVAQMQQIATQGDINIPVTAPFVENSGDVQPGGVFVARAGRSTDGHRYIADAEARGAVAIIGEKPLASLEHQPAIPYVQVDAAHVVLGHLAASYHGFPSRQLTVIGVTGTNGKTTTSHLIHSILKEATGGKAGLISTIAADFGNRTADTGLHVTTPTAPENQAYLAQMVEAGLTHVVLEMTSHGLAQGRLNGIDIDVAVLTNITHEHLDYHGSWDAYRAAKGQMFQMLATSYRKPDVPKISVVNADDPSHDYFAAFQADEVVMYGVHQSAQFTARTVQYQPDATHFNVAVDDQEQPIALHLVGEFNVSNALAAIAATRWLGIGWDAIRAGVVAVRGVSGRMERINEGQVFTAVVDFAHTPDALEKALLAARTMLPDGKRLIAVFGSAGLRDVQKRRMMAEVSAQYADITVLTAEDPRTESLDDILQMMAEGCMAQGGIEGETFIRVPDRGMAIYQACQMAQAGDVVMACGKGHEQSMCFGTIEYAWDDREAMRAALRGAPLKTLPTASKE